jgi:hypothetical protein
MGRNDQFQVGRCNAIPPIKCSSIAQTLGRDGVLDSVSQSVSLRAMIAPWLWATKSVKIQSNLPETYALNVPHRAKRVASAQE